MPPAKHSSTPKDPKKLIEQTDAPVLKPELPYEKTGQYAAGTTFAEGLVWFHNQWFLYYGCADSLVAVATAPAGSSAFSSKAATPSSSTATRSRSKTSTTSTSSSTPSPASPTCGCTSSTRAWAAIASRAAEAVPSTSASPATSYAEKPTIVTIMLGMNDGAYRATTPDIEDTYRKGYGHILDSIHEHAPAARVTLIGPSPYDDVDRPAHLSRRLQRRDAALRGNR